MIIDSLKGFGSLGCSITNISYPFVTSETDIIKQKIKSEMVVILPQANFTKEQFYELCGLVGTINKENLEEGQELEHFGGYHSDGVKITMPGLNKVTGKKKQDGRYEGLSPGVAPVLNWHCAEHNRKDKNGNPIREPEIVCLQAVSGTQGTITQVVQMIDRYNQESEEFKNEAKNKIMQWEFVDDNDKDIAFTDVDTDLFPDNESAENMDKQIPLVRTCINGKTGIHFSPTQITGIIGESQDEFKKLKAHIEKEYLTDPYIHDQIWQDGDIMFMDQTVCLHRRVDLNRQLKGLTAQQLEKRLLHRIEIYLNK
jgi:alpha-ketoglutarate-dependent taurine dioxygenase